MFLDEDQSTRSRLRACDLSGCRDLYGTCILRYSSHLQVTAINQIGKPRNVTCLCIGAKLVLTLKYKTTVSLDGVSSLFSLLMMSYLTNQCNNLETYPQEHTFLRTQMKRLDQFLCLPKGWLNWAERWRLRKVGEAAQSPTGSDLMSKKTCSCFCSVSFLLCSDRDILSPVGMDTGVIRPSIHPSIPPTPTHPRLTEISFCCHAIPAKNSSNPLEISASGQKEGVCACVCM